MARRYERQPGLLSKIKSMLLAGIIIYFIIVTLFGSWESWIAKCIEVIPCSKPMMYVMSKIVGASIKYSSGKLNYTVSAVIKDIISLSVSSMLLCIYDSRSPEGKHSSSKIKYIVINKIVVPIIVAFITALIITKIYNVLRANGNIPLIIFSVIGIAGVLCMVIGVISILNKNSLVYAVMQVVVIIVKSLASTIASYGLVLAVLLMVGDLSMFSSAIGLFVVSLIMLLGIGFMLDSTGTTSLLKDKFVSVDDSKGSWF